MVKPGNIKSGLDTEEDIVEWWHSEVKLTIRCHHKTHGFLIVIKSGTQIIGGFTDL